MLNMIAGLNYMSWGNRWENATSQGSTDAQLDEDFSRFAKDGIKHLSVRIMMSVMAPSMPTTLASTALANIRRVLDRAAAHGIKVQVDFWTQNGSSLGAPSWTKNDQIFQTHRAGYIAYMKAVVNALKDKPAIESWSVLNEPWFNGELTKASAQAAFPLFYEAVKSQDPARLVTCRFTLAYTPGSGKYDASVYDVFDVFTVTEYLDPQNPDDVRYNDRWPYWDMTISDLKARAKHLWVIEYGVSSDWASESEAATRYRLSLEKFVATGIVDRAYAWAWQKGSPTSEKFNLWTGTGVKAAYNELAKYPEGVTPPPPPPEIDVDAIRLHLNAALEGVYAVQAAIKAISDLLPS